MPAVSSETQADQEPGRPALGRGALVALAVGLPISAVLLATIAGLALLLRTAAIRHRQRQSIPAALSGLAPR